MRFDQTAIFSDLDGTLFDHNGKVSRENREAIARYMAQGGLFAIATGRCPANMAPYLSDVAYNAPSIVLNGGAIYERQSDRFLYKRFADREALAAVLRYALAAFPSVNLQVYTERDILYVSPKETLNLPFWELHQSSLFVTVDDALQTDWFKALVFGKPEETTAVDQWIMQNGLGGRFDRVFASTDIVPGSMYLELLPKGGNKGTALLECRKLDIYAGRKLIAVGDYNNDLELLQEADIAAAPCNGHPDILKIADWILPTNNESAIAALIDRIAEC